MEHLLACLSNTIFKPKYHEVDLLNWRGHSGYELIVFSIYNYTNSVVLLTIISKIDTTLPIFYEIWYI